MPTAGSASLIAFEGGEGTGKSTQAARFAERIGALLTREPGGTLLGERVRSLVLDPALGRVDARAEALLMAAARAQHVAEVIEPALAAGTSVVTDRYIGSSLAYQGYGHGLGVEALTTLSAWATADCAADLVILLVAPPRITAGRLRRPTDRLEQLGKDFHKRVAEGFLELAKTDPARWRVVDGTGTIAEVSERVWAAYEMWAKGSTDA
ncbi:MAG TPA: dTMP kinase [Acidimicrobiales bacterium]|nr:dTMP kinase [Acidimicrobiales bacterium]